MFVAGVNHNVFDRSVAILENGDAEAEDKVAACMELERYFSHIVKNETDLVLSPFGRHGGELMEALLECLEKENSQLRSSVLSVYKHAQPLLPKGLGMGMQVASHCYSVLLKTCKAAGEHLEPSSYNIQTLVELFRCMSRFDEPQFLEAVTAAAVRYTDHKELIQKCVNVCENAVDIDLEHRQDNDHWNSSLRLETLRFVKRLMQVCGLRLIAQLQEDADFWLEVLLPSLFVFHETYGSVVLDKVDEETRKTARQAVEAFLLLTQKNKQLHVENWENMKEGIKARYAYKMAKCVGVTPDWCPTLCLVLEILGEELIIGSNNDLTNKLVFVVAKAFKHDESEVRVEAFVAWRHVIDKIIPPGVEVTSIMLERAVTLLMQHLLPNNAKTGILACQKFSTWWHLIQRLGNHNLIIWKRVLIPFFAYCFGHSKSTELPVGKKYEVLHIPCAKALANVLDPEPTEQCTSEKQKIEVMVEGCMICPCSAPLLGQPAVFLSISEELFYSVGECVVTLSGRREVEMCSQLVRTIWTFLLRHITVFLDGGGIPAEKVASLVQELLRLLWKLTARSNANVPFLATYCISPLLEELVMGPHAFSPAVLASPTYYVGTANPMTGTAALFLIEVMISRPLLEVATSNTRYIVVLKAILDVGITHHNVPDFMQSVTRQLGMAGIAFSNNSSAERTKLCALWSSVAGALIKYLQLHTNVNQGNEEHHDLSCFYRVMLFPFNHFYGIPYKQAMEILCVWLELYKCFHQVAMQNVSTLDINEVCETMAMEIYGALIRHCPTSANQAVPLLKAVQGIIMLIPFGDICGTRRSSKSESGHLLLPDRAQISNPTNYIAHTLRLMVKLSHMFYAFERSGERYNTAGTLIMSCLETMFNSMNVTSIAAAVPVMSSLSVCLLNLLQVNPLQDGSTKVWHESLHRMLKCYFSFIETYIAQKSVNDFLNGWMEVLLDVGFKHPQQEIRGATLTFWDSVVVPAFARDSTDEPEFLREAREKSQQAQGTSHVVSDSNCSLVEDREQPVAVSAFPEQIEEHPKNRQSLLQQLEVEGHILTKHQKEVLRHRKHGIPVLYNSNLQPLQQDSIISGSSQDTCDFVASYRIIEPLSNNVNELEVKGPSVASSLKVLEPRSPLRWLADYRKRMMINVEAPVPLAYVSGGDSTGSTDIHDQQVVSGASPGVLNTPTESQRTERPNSLVARTLASHLCEAVPLPSSLLIASEFPSVRKCSVSVCRIDTTLGPGATICVSSGGCRDIVRIPERSGSTFKVYEDKPATTSSRCFNGKFGDVTDCAGAVKKVGAWSDVHSEEIRSVSSGTQPSVQLPRVHVYSVPVGGSSPVEMLQGPVAQCETPSPARTCNNVDVSCEGTVGLPVSEQDVQPSKKKLVSFPDDADLSSIRYSPSAEGGIDSRRRRRSPFAKSRRPGRRRTAGKCRAAGSSGTSPEDGRPVSVNSASIPNTDPPCEKGLNEGDKTEMNDESSGSYSENLAVSVEEVCSELSQNGSGPLEEEILSLLPVDSIVQYVSSRLANDSSFSMPFSDHKKIMESIANRVTPAQFVMLFSNAVKADSAQNMGCP